MKDRILAILHLPPPDHGAGIVGQFIEQSHLINQSFNIDYINLSTAANLSDIGRINPRKFLVTIKLWIKVFFSLIRRNYQICYLTINACGSAWYKELVLVALVKLCRVKLVYHYHNKGVKVNANNRFKKALYRFQFKNTKVILLSPLLFADIANFVSKDNVYYCPNGIPDENTVEFNALEKVEPKNHNSIVQILFLSNLFRSKGLYTLLEACELLKHRKVAFKCLLVGAEGDILVSDLFEVIHRLNLGSKVKYLGKYYGQQKNNILAETDILAFPTFYEKETFGLVNLEAMQFSKPVISTYEGAIPDIVEDGITGFLVPQKDAIALADKLEILIKNPELRKLMGAQGRIKYENYYTIKHFEERMISIFNQILNPKYD